MLGGWQEVVTDEALTHAVGPATLDRARPYARRSVLGLKLTEDGRRATAHVQGGDPAPYRTTVVRTDGGRTGWIGACTCPVGDDCKHAVAVLLALRPRVGPVGGGRPGVPGWEQQLEELVSAAADAAPASTVPIGLQFETAEGGRGSVGSPGVRQRLVRLRPVIPGARGNWVRSGISWKQLQYDSARAGWDPAHLAALRALHATHSAARNQYYSYAPVDVYLHEFGPGPVAAARRGGRRRRAAHDRRPPAPARGAGGGRGRHRGRPAPERRRDRAVRRPPGRRPRRRPRRAVLPRHAPARGHPRRATR
ncbi:SWIM zinc finger family protein [Blastococcus sp. TML/C7B]|uniref:SWIM zinc finger family protein n=1 Tax=Blastococcus sp. TML/C7B TaxID=2798728 RepID=UPI0028168F84|nr:SWIM zinc finger family protein [Blastococcus sp. TML/C7B]